jgi:hypothetical protein
MDFDHFRAVGERLAVAGDAGLVRVDHRGIAKNHRERLAAIAEGNGLPALVSPELGEREPIRHFEGVLILGGDRRPGGHAGERYRDTRADQRFSGVHGRRSSFG